VWVLDRVRKAREALGPGASDAEVLDSMGLSGRARRTAANVMALTGGRWFGDSSGDGPPWSTLARDGRHHEAEADDRDEVAGLLSRLHPRHREVVALTYGLDGGGERSSAEVGKVMGFSHQRTRQILLKSLGKLREWECRRAATTGRGVA
ncbi:MAG: hypothetical protein LC745_05680, partial [Planctomycetia bacterium]|nr:hypothetical protein [Planctomycetia bacterium]